MSLDGSIIDLSVSMFDWAKFRRTKGAIKLHLLLDHDGYLPSFAVVTEGKTSEIKVARTLRFAPGTILAIDRGYNDYEWFRELTQEDVYFVTRMKEKAVYEVKEEVRGSAKQQRGARPDRLLSPAGAGGRGAGAVPSRRDTGTRRNRSPSCSSPTCWPSARSTIAAIYKDRWQVELFFKALKQTAEDQDVRGDQRQCGPDPGVDGADRDAGAEVPAVEIEVRLVVVDSGGSAAAATVLLSRSVGVAGRPFCRPHRLWPACTTMRNSLKSRGRRQLDSRKPIQNRRH